MCNDEPQRDADQGEEQEDHPFYPHHVLDMLMLAYLLLGLVLTLAILVPFHLHEKADPLYTPPGIKPEWYFLAMYQAVKYVPATVGVIGTGAVFALIVVWPFVGALLDRFFPNRRLYRLIGILGLLGWLTLSGVGYICERDVTVLGRQYHIDLKGIPHPKAAGETHDNGSQPDG